MSTCANIDEMQKKAGSPVETIKVYFNIIKYSFSGDMQRSMPSSDRSRAYVTEAILVLAGRFIIGRPRVCIFAAPPSPGDPVR